MLGSQRTQTLASWRVPFFTIWTGQAFSLMGSSLVSFALTWQLVEATDSAVTLTIASLMNILPVIVLGPFMGVLIDRWNRRWVLIIADGSIALFTALLAYLFWLGIASTWHIYVILFLRSLGNVFHEPAMMSSTSLMVPEEQLTRVSAMNSTLEGTLRFISPPLGAFLTSTLWMQSILALDVITAILAIVPLFFVHIPQPPIVSRLEGTHQLNVRRTIIRDLLEGLWYIWSQRGLFLLFITAAIGGCVVQPIFTFFPLLVTRCFAGGAIELGWLQSAYGLGFIVSGVILSFWGGFERRMVTSIVGLLGVGLGIFVIGLVPATAFSYALVIWFCVGLSLPMVMVPIRAIYQSSVAPEMQGRFFTLNHAIVRIVAPLGLVIAGPLVDSLGIRVLYFASGIVLVGLALVRVFTPAIFSLGEPPTVRD